MDYEVSTVRPENGTFIAKISNSIVGLSEYVNGKLAKYDTYGKFHKCNFKEFLQPFTLQPEAKQILKQLVMNPEEIEDEDEKLIREINKDLELIFPTDDTRTIKFSREEFVDCLNTDLRKF